MSLEAGGSVAGGRDVKVDSFRLLAGKAEVRGDGEASIAGETLRLSGSLSLPAGKAADYGVGESLAWEKIAGEWEISGPWSRLGGKGSLSVAALAIRALPPLPLVLKIDGVPSEALHISADVSGQRFKATAEGTWTFPFDPSRTASEWTVAAREIDLADSDRWVSAVAASLRVDTGGASRYLAGFEGKGEADGKIRVTGDKIEATGRFDAVRVDLRGASLRALRAEGEFGSLRSPNRWAVRVEGKIGDGTFHVAGSGDGGNGTGSRERWKGSKAPRPSPFSAGTDPGK